MTAFFGAHRVHTSSRRRDSVPNDAFVIALAGGVAAAREGGPILLVSSTDVPPATVDALRDALEARGPSPHAATRRTWLDTIGAARDADRAKLDAVGGFEFWRDLPPAHCGEDVVAERRRLLAKWDAEVKNLPK